MKENVGFNHWYCAKALQYIDLKLDCNQPKELFGPVLEFSMWLSQQIPPGNHPVGPYSLSQEDLERKAIQDNIKKYSYTVDRWMSLKP